MKKRVLTGLVMFLVIGLMIASRFLTPYVFDAFVLVLMLASCYEMTQALKVSNKQCYNLVVYLTPFAIVCAYIFARNALWALLIQILIMLIIFIICFAVELIKKPETKTVSSDKSSADLKQNENLLDSTFNTFKVCFYPLILIGTLVGLNHFGKIEGLIAIALAFLIACFTDMFAYFFGMMLGQKGKSKRLCPTISPKKSVVGFVFGSVGGMVASVLVMLLFYVWPIADSVITSLSTGVAVALFISLGLLGTLVSSFGDLLSSAIKRRVGIKDFGSIFPGHGGVLDRLDSIMFTSTLVFTCMLFIL